MASHVAEQPSARPTMTAEVLRLRGGAEERHDAPNVSRQFSEGFAKEAGKQTAEMEFKNLQDTDFSNATPDGLWRQYCGCCMSNPTPPQPPTAPTTTS